MTENQTPHFSGKVLLLSLIFLLSGLGIYGLRSVIGLPQMQMPVTPQLLSAMPEEIEVKLDYEETYRPARANEALYSGGSIKTGEKEFAELVLGSNSIQIDEETEIKLIHNSYSNSGVYTPGEPRLKLQLLSGSIWVNAFDLIEVHTKKHQASLHHSVGILTYTEPINRVMVVTGDLDLNILDEEGVPLVEFVIPLGNQVTFVDSQITDTYAVLKPSKLKKELKMTVIPANVLVDDWVVRNANDFEADQKAFSDGLISSEMAYKVKQGYQTVLSYLAFTPEAKRQMALSQAKTMLSYILGGLPDVSDRPRAKEIISDFDALVVQRGSDARLQELIVETLFAIEKAAIGTPAYELRESLMQKVAEKEGDYVYRLYLTDLRRALYENDLKSADKIVEKWLASWPEAQSGQSPDEYDRQSQILNHTILAFADRAPNKVLNAFDETGLRKMASAVDTEEARFEVTSDRLQITAALVANYRYAEAKQYLKNSYLSLDINNLSPQLASTQVFLATGKLLAQRIEFADVMMHSAAEPIDETKFLAYFETVKRDKALSEDLRKFFELDEEEVVAEEEGVKAPTASEVASRFLDARINVNFADISLLASGGFVYKITDARLIDRDMEGNTLTFDAIYDHASNSVSNVFSDDKSYQGSFILSDIVILLKSGGELESQIRVPSIEEGIDLLITDQDKIAAEEGQAIAQDVAKQLAYNQLKEVNIIIPEVKFDIDILDTLSLNHFHIKNALIPHSGEDLAIRISFDYSSVSGEATNIVEKQGEEDNEVERELLNDVPVESLAEAVLEEIERLENKASQGPKLPGTSGAK